MIKKELYDGRKFRWIGVENTYTIYGEKVEKDIFIPTKGYVNFLNQQREKEEKMELEKLKQKLELEFQLYGEVDEVEYQRFLNLTKKQQTKLFVNKTKYYKG